jgi:hypothetical protein
LREPANGGILIGAGRAGSASFSFLGCVTMSSEGIDRQQQKMNEFLRLLPLTAAIAGLPDCELGRQFTEGQLDVRATALRAAYKVARQLLLDVAK